MILTISHKIDKFLYKRGIHIEQVRRLLILQIQISLVLSMFFLLFCRDFWAVHFLLASFLGTINFYILAQAVQKLVFLRKEAIFSLLFNFYARLVFLGIVLYIMLIWAQFSLVAVVAGFSTVLVSIMLWGALFYIEQKDKEAHVNGS